MDKPDYICNGIMYNMMLRYMPHNVHHTAKPYRTSMLHQRNPGRLAMRKGGWWGRRKGDELALVDPSPMALQSALWIVPISKSSKKRRSPLPPRRDRTKLKCQFPALSLALALYLSSQQSRCCDFWFAGSLIATIVPAISQIQFRLP